MSNTLARFRNDLITTTRGDYFLSIAVNFLTLLLIVTALSLALFSKPVFAETNVSAVRVWSSPDYTRFTLESDKLIDYTISMLDNPGRVVIDLEFVTFSSALESLPNKIQDSDPLVHSVRIGKFKPTVLRLVLDLKTSVVPQAFVLDPMDNFGYRLVIDIYSSDKAAQLDSLDTLVSE
ncbi:MAG: AMIN domain-containing protein, partial [Nitrosomonas sp.]|nr:AMIN domain-containing protein [Nitrosomonas sp.]